MGNILGAASMVFAFIGFLMLIFIKGSRLKGLSFMFAGVIMASFLATPSAKQEAVSLSPATPSPAPASEPPKETVKPTANFAAYRQQVAERDAEFANLPAGQRGMVDAIVKARIGFATTTNDLAKGGIRRTRAKEICAAQPTRKVSNWRGTITKLSTNSDGLGVVYVSIGEDMSVQTMNNSFSDIGANTLIDPDEKLFQQLTALKTGDRVIFSGTFVSPPEKTDCFYETSMTMNGSMSDPTFVFKFSDMKRF